jgi:hypothetical protein
MVQDLFAAMYGLLHGAQGPLYIEHVYPQSGAALLGWTVITVSVYYYVVGWVSAEYNMTRHWFVTLALNSAVSMMTALAVCRFAFGSWDLEAPVVTFTLIQGLYAALFFVVLSLAVKWGSPNARRTPF